MADDIAGADSVAFLDVGDERDDCRHLLVGKRAITELVPGLTISIPTLAELTSAVPRQRDFPACHARYRFIDQAIDRPVFIDAIMRGNLRFGRGQAAQRAFAIGHAGIMEDDHRDGQLALVEIG